jgi:hypothetical protein
MKDETPAIQHTALFSRQPIPEAVEISQHLIKDLGWKTETAGCRGELGAAVALISWPYHGVRKLDANVLIECLDGRSNGGQKPAEVIFPNLFADIRSIVDGQSQTDPQFRNARLYTRLSAAEVRRQLMETKGYGESVPSEETIRVKLNKLGYHPARVAKTKPKKKFHKQTPSSTP